jgi:hypothetical protein
MFFREGTGSTGESFLTEIAFKSAAGDKISRFELDEPLGTEVVNPQFIGFMAKRWVAKRFRAIFLPPIFLPSLF